MSDVSTNDEKMGRTLFGPQTTSRMKPGKLLELPLNRVFQKYILGHKAFMNSISQPVTSARNCEILILTFRLAVLT